jgi:hypothetical protein
MLGWRRKRKVGVHDTSAQRSRDSCPKLGCRAVSPSVGFFDVAFERHSGEHAPHVSVVTADQGCEVPRAEGFSCLFEGIEDCAAFV